MHRLHYQHPGTWFGDCMPIFADGAFQLFHQRDTRRPGPFGEPFGWALARTVDFVHYEDLGEAVERGADDAQDQFIFAGSVFAAENRYHALYTGFNRDYPALGKPAQVLMHAISDDLQHWTRVEGELVPPQPGYDPDNWRDPYVLRDDDRDRWVMILGARKDEDTIGVSGRTVWFTSTDLETWDFQGDFWAPDLYTMHEMPDLFWMGDRWYLLTTEYSDRSKTIYRSSPGTRGTLVRTGRRRLRRPVLLRGSIGVGRRAPLPVRLGRHQGGRARSGRLAVGRHPGRPRGPAAARRLPRHSRPRAGARGVRPGHRADHGTGAARRKGWSPHREARPPDRRVAGLAVVPPQGLGGPQRGDPPVRERPG